jgi:Protein of unknown function (DUF2889)
LIVHIPDPFSVPGYRRRISISPHTDYCVAALEDDYHAMAVTISHDGTRITGLASEMARLPWTTCPGAADVIARTFVGVMLQDVLSRGDKRLNCTHLYDLTLLAATHALEKQVMIYDIAVADPVEGLVRAEIRRNDRVAMTFVHRADVLSEPEALAGRTLFDLRDWIAGLPANADRESARLLQWATIIAHGRIMTLEQHADISRTPASCYTFQEERRHDAVRLQTIREFSLNGVEPLAGFDGERFER